MGRAMLRGILWVSLGVFPAVLLVGVFYRFPVPWRGQVSGWTMFQEGPDEAMELVWMLAQAVVYYTLWGGFLVLAVLGAVAGSLGWLLGRPDHSNRYVRNIALGLGLVAAALFSVLGEPVGP